MESVEWKISQIWLVSIKEMGIVRVRAVARRTICIMDWIFGWLTEDGRNDTEQFNRVGLDGLM